MAALTRGLVVFLFTSLAEGAPRKCGDDPTCVRMRQYDWESLKYAGSGRAGREEAWLRRARELVPNPRHVADHVIESDVGKKMRVTIVRDEKGSIGLSPEQQLRQTNILLRYFQTYLPAMRYTQGHHLVVATILQAGAFSDSEIFLLLEALFEVLHPEILRYPMTMLSTFTVRLLRYAAVAPDAESLLSSKWSGVFISFLSQISVHYGIAGIDILLNAGKPALFSVYASLFMHMREVGEQGLAEGMDVKEAYGLVQMKTVFDEKRAEIFELAKTFISSRRDEMNRLADSKLMFVESTQVFFKHSARKYTDGNNEKELILFDHFHEPAPTTDQCLNALALLDRPKVENACTGCSGPTPDTLLFAEGAIARVYGAMGSLASLVKTVKSCSTRKQTAWTERDESEYIDEVRSIFFSSFSQLAVATGARAVTAVFGTVNVRLLSGLSSGVRSVPNVIQLSDKSDSETSSCVESFSATSVIGANEDGLDKLAETLGGLGYAADCQRAREGTELSSGIQVLADMTISRCDDRHISVTCFLADGIDVLMAQRRILVAESEENQLMSCAHQSLGDVCNSLAQSYGKLKLASRKLELLKPTQDSPDLLKGESREFSGFTVGLFAQQSSPRHRASITLNSAIPNNAKCQEQISAEFPSPVTHESLVYAFKRSVPYAPCQSVDAQTLLRPIIEAKRNEYSVAVEVARVSEIASNGKPLEKRLVTCKLFPAKLDGEVISIAKLSVLPVLSAGPSGDGVGAKMSMLSEYSDDCLYTMAYVDLIRQGLIGISDGTLPPIADSEGFAEGFHRTTAAIWKGIFVQDPNVHLSGIVNGKLAHGIRALYKQSACQLTIVFDPVTEGSRKYSNFVNMMTSSNICGAPVSAAGAAIPPTLALTELPTEGCQTKGAETKSVLSCSFRTPNGDAIQIIHQAAKVTNSFSAKYLGFLSGTAVGGTCSSRPTATRLVQDCTSLATKVALEST